MVVNLLILIGSYSGDHPNSVEIRINTEVKQDHKIISGSNWSLDVIKDTGSLLPKYN